MLIKLALLLALSARAEPSPEAYLKQLDDLNRRCPAAQLSVGGDFLRHFNEFSRGGTADLRVSKTVSDTQDAIQAFFDSQRTISAGAWTRIREKSGGENIPRNQELVRCSVRLKDLRAELVLLQSAGAGRCEDIPKHAEPLYALLKDPRIKIPAGLTLEHVLKTYDARCRDRGFMKENAAQLKTGEFWLARDAAGRLVLTKAEIQGWGIKDQAAYFFSTQNAKDTGWAVLGAGQGLLLAAGDIAAMLSAAGQQHQDMMSGRAMVDALGKLYRIVSDPQKYGDEEVAKARELLRQWEAYRDKFHKAANAGDTRYVTQETVRWLSQLVLAVEGPKALPRGKVAAGPKTVSVPKSAPAEFAAAPAALESTAVAEAKTLIEKVKSLRAAGKSAEADALADSEWRRLRPGISDAEARKILPELRPEVPAKSPAKAPTHWADNTKYGAKGMAGEPLKRAIKGIFKVGDAVHGTAYKYLPSILKNGMKSGTVNAAGEGIYFEVVTESSVSGPGAAFGKAAAAAGNTGTAPVMLRVPYGETGGLTMNTSDGVYMAMVAGSDGKTLGSLSAAKIQAFDPAARAWTSLENFMKAYPDLGSYEKALQAAGR